MTKKIFSILISLLILGGCSSGTTCKQIKNKTKKLQCEEVDQGWYNRTGWRYDRPSRDKY